MTAMITPTLLVRVGATPRNAGIFAPLLESARQVKDDSFQTISSKSGVAMLVAQLAHESGYYGSLSESLNYSAAALRTGNRARYFSQDAALRYGYIKRSDGSYLQRADEYMIAKLYYGGRLGNHGSETEDGWVFRGGGLIQTTGRANFTLFGQSVNMSPEDAADYVRTPEGAVASALFYWRTRSLLIPASRGDVTRCTEIIQGADGGLASRIALYKSALSAIT